MRRILLIACMLAAASPALAWDITRGEDPLTKERTAEITVNNGKAGAEALKLTIRCFSRDAGRTMVSVVGGGPSGNADIAAEPKDIRVTVDDRPATSFAAVPLREQNGELSFTATQAAEPRVSELLSELRLAQQKVTLEMQGHTYTLDAADNGKTIDAFAAACSMTLPNTGA